MSITFVCSTPAKQPEVLAIRVRKPSGERTELCAAWHFVPFIEFMIGDICRLGIERSGQHQAAKKDGGQADD